MKPNPLLILILPLGLLWGGCSGVANPLIGSSADSTTAVNEAELLINYLEESRDFINTPDIENATSVLADEVYQHLGDKRYHIVDLRSADDYYPAHIPGAFLVEMSDLYDYMRSIPLDYIEKVVLVCYAGQKASYTTGLLRLLGYDKVFFMKWGMSAWSKPVADANWTKNMSNSFNGRLRPAEASLPEHGDLPVLYTGKTTGKEILEARVSNLMQEDYSYVKIKADELMMNPAGYFIVHYDPLMAEKDIPLIEGSYSLTPGKSLKLSNDQKSLPPYDYIVVTSLTGQTAGMVTAYLRVLGYDARFLTYGLNSLAVNTLAEKGYSVFNSKGIKRYKTEADKAPILANKPKKSSAGGC